MGMKNQRAVYEYVKISDAQRYMNGSVFFKGLVYEWDRFRNTASHTLIIITPVTPTPQERKISFLSSARDLHCCRVGILTEGGAIASRAYDSKQNLDLYFTMNA